VPRLLRYAALGVALVLLAPGGQAAGTHAAALLPARGTVRLRVQPGQNQSYAITASGTYVDFPSELYVLVHAGTGRCAATFAVENSLVERQMQEGGSTAATALISQELGTGLETSGHYTEQAYWGVGAPPGSYWVCAYLMGPQGADVEPGVPPEATASARLSIRGAPIAAVAVAAFYATSAAWYDAVQAGESPGSPPRVLRYPAGTATAVLYAEFRNARPGVTQTSIDLQLPTPWAVTLTTKPYRLTEADGGVAYTMPSAIATQSGASGGAGNAHGYPSGLYRAELRVNGRIAAQTTFRIGGS
jgi:hypothetical protein